MSDCRTLTGSKLRVASPREKDKEISDRTEIFTN